jgi:HPt (histidine-containing phosphotransfer) domain-containing protein
MSEESRKPIYSSRIDDPSDSDTIDRFVIRLAERIDVLQDAEADGDLAHLEALAGELLVEAREAGFEALVAFAETLEGACVGGDSEAARERLLELTEIAQRIRLGHRGAV